ncbi:putative metalloprotease CJM1_0395 family protein [Candidatus Uabimicrobium amorphum]|uniref:SprA-related family protein n=1 Tax=Uabimicrobium amorphum TaxID=2596890 RepID=A0A5S9IQV5_UABAM|nr:putative metalloprotease CJM1_0395 family protein [Candidatus Uabimicrobium amorphum]BBM85911.1 hypothetical protein UABAM_04293 [Candidatus Uabimicrobium amorphum]
MNIGGNFNHGIEIPRSPPKQTSLSDLKEETGKLASEKKLEMKPISEMNMSEKRKLEKLKLRDQEVRTHEQAHVAAGGKYIKSAIHYDYQVGPDGRKYAVGGNVKIDSQPVPNQPQETIAKMQVVRKAALAPAQPSSADHQVAQKASSEEAKARQELAQKKLEEQATEKYSFHQQQGESDSQDNFSIVV